MKNLLVLSFLFSLVLFTSCAKWPEDATAVTPQGEYQLKSANANMSGDTIIVPLNTLIIFTLEKNLVKISADWNFGNGTPVVSGDLVSTKFLTEGVYWVKATDLSVSPNVTKTAIIRARKNVVVVPPVTGETSVIVISSTYSAGVNTVVLGLRCTAISAFDATAPVAAEVQYETPSVIWTATSLPVSGIVTVNSVKYYQWSLTVSNNQKIRFGWLIGGSWAYDSKSIYRQADGLYVIYFKDGVIFKEVQTASLPGTFGDTKVRGSLEIISGVQNIVLYFAKLNFNGGTPSLKYKITDGSEQIVALTDNGDYYSTKVPILSSQAIAFWPQSTIGTVNITDSIVYNAERTCGLIQVINLKSAEIGVDNFGVKLG